MPSASTHLDMIEMPSPFEADFSEDQKAYLSGFFTGAMHRGNVPLLSTNAQGQFSDQPQPTQTVYGTPIEDLCREERIKFERNGLDCFDNMLANSEQGVFPDADEMFRYKFHGLFYVTPAQESLMLRARMAGGVIRSYQLRGMAEIAEDWGNGFCDITTRANLQIREIMPVNAPSVLMKLSDLGLTSQGAGADNVRNITATPTSGFDPSELIDVMPYANAMHHCILKNRNLYGLPRKFNIAYDSGGAISVCADTNDIGFQAVQVAAGDHGIEPGIYFRMQLCGITGHKQFASDCGVLLKPSETIPVAAALIRVFIEHGDRTDRKKARLKYLVDAWGVEKFLDHVQQKLAFPLRKLPLEKCATPTAKQRHGHLGIHPQSDGKFYLGIVVPAARMNGEQMRLIADLAERYGKGELRLTVWQNLLIPHVSESDLDAVKKALFAAGIRFEATAIGGGIVACTGNRGCKYAAADTKGHARFLSEYLEQQVSLDQPINIHLTGCNHSCAQHYIGDIGMMAVKVKTTSGETVEGYNIALGGGVDQDQAIAKEVWKAIAFEDIPPLLTLLLQRYLAQRENDESFSTFTRRHSAEQLRELCH